MPSRANPAAFSCAGHGGDSRHLTIVWTEPAKGADPFQATIPFQLALRDMQRMGICVSQPELPGSQACCVLRFDSNQPLGDSQ